MGPGWAALGIEQTQHERRVRWLALSPGDLGLLGYFEGLVLLVGSDWQPPNSRTLLSRWTHTGKDCVTAFKQLGWVPFKLKAGGHFRPWRPCTPSLRHPTLSLVCGHTSCHGPLPLLARIGHAATAAHNTDATVWPPRCHCPGSCCIPRCYRAAPHSASGPAATGHNGCCHSHCCH